MLDWPAVPNRLLRPLGFRFGVGALFGLTRLSRVIKLVEPDIRGRLAIFFPGTYDRNNYRLLDARDGWNYLAVPITLHGTGDLT